MSANNYPENQSLSEEDYLRTELLSEVRRGYINGQLISQTLTTNVAYHFNQHLRNAPFNTYALVLFLRLGNDFVFKGARMRLFILEQCS